MRIVAEVPEVRRLARRVAVAVIVGILSLACLAPPVPPTALAGVAAATRPGTWSIDRDALPAASGRVFTAPGPKGGVYVLAVDAQDGSSEQSASRSVLALLNAAGRIRSGWPIAIAGWSCDVGGVEAWDPRVIWVSEGNVNEPVSVLCRSDGTDGSATGSTWAFAFDATGRLLPGWPVDVSPAAVGGGFVVGNSGNVLLVQDGDGWRLASIDVRGTLRVGVRWTAHPASSLTGYGEAGPARLGPDGHPYVWQRRVDGTEISSFGLTGQLAGWPVVVPETDVVDLVFAGSGSGNGFVYIVARVAGGSVTRVRCLRDDGRSRYVAPADVPVRVGVAYSGGGPSAYTVYVAGEGSAWVFGGRGDRTLAYALDRIGRPRVGWPFVVSPGLQWQGWCGAGVTPCSQWLAWPASGAYPGYILYLPQAAASARTGGRLVALARSGRVVPGWPVTLRRPGAQFWSVDVGSDGTIFAVAVEPEDHGGSSSTVLAISPDSTVRWTKTVVQP